MKTSILLQQTQNNNLISLYSQRRLEDALTQGNSLIKQFPDNPLIRNILGVVYSRLDKNENK